MVHLVQHIISIINLCTFTFFVHFLNSCSSYRDGDGLQRFVPKRVTRVITPET